MEQCGSEVAADPAGCPSLPAGSAPPWQPAAFRQDAGQADVAGVAQQPESGSPADYHRILLKDGGGLSSTLDWQVPPPGALRDPLSAVRKAIWSSTPKDACCRAAALCGKTLEHPFFTDSEVHLMQVAVCSALGIDSAWALEPFELTPYKFNLLESLALRMDDPDVALCKVLRCGAPTGVWEPIPASGVWPPCSGKWGDEVAEACDLFWCTSNHISAEQEPAKVRALVQKEVDLGYLVHIAGGMSAVQQRFPDGSLAIGKLGLVTCAGKEDRLIGDPRASGASPAARFLGGRRCLRFSCSLLR